MNSMSKLEVQAANKQNTANHGHRWTHEEMTKLIALWLKGKDIDEIAFELGVTRAAAIKKVYQMRKNGIPLPRRNNGHKAARRNQSWTQTEVEYVVRRRNEGATGEDIGIEIGRTFLAIQGLIAKLKLEGVRIQNLGGGRQRLWNVESLKEATVGRSLTLVVDEKFVRNDQTCRAIEDELRLMGGAKP